MGTDIYNHRYQHNPIEQELENSREEFYSSYPDITQPEVLSAYEDKNIPYVSIPPEIINSGKIWKIILDRYSEDYQLLPEHALSSHPEDCKLAIGTLGQSLSEGNVVTGVKDCYEKERAKEATRLILTTREPVDRDIPRYLHLQMALELAEQIRTETATNESVLKNIRKLAKSSPGFATMVSCLLVNLGPITENLNIKLNDIFDYIPNLTPNRESDRRLIHDAYHLLQRGSVFSKLQNEKAMALILEKFPEEQDNLYKNATFKEKISPIIVFESAFNIFQNIFEKYGIEFNQFALQKLGKKLEDTITSRVVTAYVQHHSQQNLGPYHVILSDKTLSKFPSPTISHKPPQTP